MAIHYEDSRLEIHRFVVGPIDNNVFILQCKQSKDGLLVDAADEPELLLKLCSQFHVRMIVETHGHADHIQAVPSLREAGYEVAVARQDAEMLPSYDAFLEDGEIIAVGQISLRTIHTPGHTPGSTCFLVEGSPVLFSGDTLFPGGPGNTAGRYGDFPTIIDSIRHKLFDVLDPKTHVLPGHGADTTIGAELPHLDEWIARGW